ncbi:hypothetical protein BHE74_00047233 [Ensete ventricosum]|nr:hypothetical protein BHE74_00047233 [Ensete ventricosum]
MSFYTGYYRSFVSEIFNASMAYHAVVLLHTVRGLYSDVRVLPTTAVACRPYPCQVGRTTTSSTIPMSGRFCCVGSTTLEIWSWTRVWGRDSQSRKSIRPSRGSGNELVEFKYSTADLTELGLGK